LNYPSYSGHQVLQRVVIVMEVANSHRLPIIQKLAKTLVKNSIEVLILCESRLALTFEGSDNIFTLNFEKDIENLRQAFKFEKLVSVVTSDNYVEESKSGLEQSNLLRDSSVQLAVEDFSPQLSIVWSGNFYYQKGTISALNRLKNNKIFFMEVAWFTQQHFIYFDDAGVNYKSNLRKKILPKISESQKLALDTWLQNYKTNKFSLSRKTSQIKKIFVPLQVDTDTSIQQGSPFKSMSSFIEFLEQWLPANIEVVFKSHPKANYNYLLCSKRKNFTFLYEGKVEDYLPESDLVIGLNSTVLLESRIYTKRVISFASGVFNGRGIFSEASPEDSFENCVEKISLLKESDFYSFFYELIFNRQISLDKLENEDPAHLFSRKPFDEFYLEPKYRDQLKQNQVNEGKIMLKIGHSKIAKSASLDVDCEGTIEIGNNSEVRHHAVLEVSGKYNGSIKIGNGSVVGVGNWFQGSGEIIVEDNVIIGPYVAVVSTNHQYENLDIPISLQPLTPGKIHIKEGVWIGAHCTIAQNVTIGKNAIIAANSFVNKDVPDWAVFGGTPARLLKMRNN